MARRSLAPSRPLLALLPALALTAGCAAWEDGAAHHPFCRQYAPALCGWVAACAPLRLDAPEATCVARELLLCDDDLAALRPELMAGRLAWSDEAAARCLAALDSGQCGLDRAAACGGLVTGLVRPGGTCFNPTLPAGLQVVGAADECAGAGACPAATCGATCPAVVGLGQGCWPGGPGPICPDGAVCVLGPTDLTGVCQALRGTGAGCGDGGPGCLASDFCFKAAGLIDCQDAPGGCTCQPRLPAGTACTDDAQCRSGLLCGEGACRAEVGALGQACLPGLLTPCQGDLTCQRAGAADVHGTCRAPLQVGAACLDASACAPGLACQQDGTCAAPRVAGAACLAPALAGVRGLAECALGLECRSGTCAHKPTGVGAPCDGGCFGVGVACVDGACARVVGAGAPCGGSAACQVAQFCGDDGICHLAVEGTACTAPADCQSYACLGGVCVAACLGG